MISHPLQGAQFCNSRKDTTITDGTTIRVSEHQLTETGEKQNLAACGQGCMKNSESDRTPWIYPLFLWKNQKKMINKTLITIYSLFELQMTGLPVGCCQSKNEASERHLGISSTHQNQVLSHRQDIYRQSSSSSPSRTAASPTATLCELVDNTVLPI